MDNDLHAHPGRVRFDYFLQQLQTALTTAAATENPALSVYSQNARTPLFMLEGLSRLYAGITNKKFFKKLNDKFKAFEDLLGAVDYYDSFSKEFSGNEKIPGPVKDYIIQQKENKLVALNAMLAEKGWVGMGNKRMVKIFDKLAIVEWPGPEADSAGIRKVYLKSIRKDLVNIESGKISFHDVEKDVHELRRELRWLSIYPQALRGLIQLKPTVNSPEFLQKYQLPDILNSPYNKMPEPGDTADIIYVSADHFYALSWLIAELGKLKDSGLRIVVLKEAIQAISKSPDEEAEKEVLALCGEGQMNIPDILKQAEEISEQFFGEKILEELVIG